MNPSELADKQRPKQVGIVAYLAPGIALVLTLVLLLWQVFQLISTSRWVDHTDLVIAQANLLERQIMDLEASLRGFMITGKKEFSEPYLRARNAIPESMKKLQALVQDCPREEEEIRDIQSDLDRWVTSSEIAFQTKRTRIDRNSLVAAENGQRIMDQIRGIFSDFIGFETTIRDSRTRKIQKFTYGALTVAMISLMMIVGVGFRFLVLRHRWEKALTESEKRQAFLAEVTPLLSESLSFEKTLTQIAELAVREFSDWCAVDLFESDKGKRIAVVHADPAKSALARELQIGFPPGISRIHQDTPILVPEIDWKRVSTYLRAQQQELIRKLGIRSYIVTPLLARGRMFGTLTFVTSHRQFDKNDLAFALEIGSRSALAADNARLYEEATRALQMRDETLAIVAHDLKHPLGSMKIWGQLLRKSLSEDTLSPKSQALLDKAVHNIDQASDQGMGLIADLLDLAKIESGGFQLNRESLILHNLVEEVISLERPLAEKRELTFETDTDSLGTHRVYADQKRIHQVLANLIENAVKFTQPGGLVAVKGIATEKDLVIEVTDTGPGISAEVIPRLFRKYYQPSESRKQGSGLGLFIAKGIVDAHGGNIWVESRLGVGSSFFVSLPIDIQVQK